MGIMLKLEKPNLTLSSDRSSVPLSEKISSAASVIAPVWPLKTIIACNPLLGLEDLPFEEAVKKSTRYHSLGKLAISGPEAVNREIIKWLAAFLDEGQAAIAMPNRERGFYRTFVDLAKYDRQLKQNPSAADLLKKLPENPEAAIEQSLAKLRILEEDHEEFLRQNLAALTGWAGFIQWRTYWQNAGEGLANPITLTEYLAVRLIITLAVWPEACVLKQEFDLPSAEFEKIIQAEDRFRNQLLVDLVHESHFVERKKASHAEAQLIFCIDVRSEPFRRAIEAQGNYQTFGFAGFFGLPIRAKSWEKEEAFDSCPVLLKPCHEVHEEPVNNAAVSVTRSVQRRSFWNAVKSYYPTLKYNFSTPFALVEMIGPWLGLQMLARTFTPKLYRDTLQKAMKAVVSKPATKVSLESINLSQQIDYCESALRMMGLTENFSLLIVMCGHGSETRNNAYATALDCGACGGNHGGFNAKTLVKMLNTAKVRSGLLDKGITIPGHTWFLAAEHNTTTDEVVIYDEKYPLSVSDLVAKLRKNLEKARVLNANARSSSLVASSNFPSSNENVSRRSCDWSEVRPEWGLARNAAFVVGPRELTSQLKLEGRCFLHSYDWKRDDDAKFLKTILTAPMVVGQWINNQYLFSTWNNVAYGGGSKVTKNVIGKFGIMQGNASDLMHGLPLQSVYRSDEQAFHEPLRLLTVVYAPRERLTQLIERNPVLQKLFYNGWVHLVVIEPSENRAYQLHRDGQWELQQLNA